ncbi:(11Z)-hexadec-11-enoyl-CoA conjugase-like [Anoplolepis gracilipes]|uniref:(11Z)-hexadec-11-enoyl-CoA conjugase-like n=1 Tax=Anoplolepis gracilipes TaxID=354296 RepID=UPI003B9DEFE6
MGTEENHDKTDNKTYEVEEMFNKKIGTDMNYRHSFVWPLVITHTLLQISWLIGLYTLLFHEVKLATKIWTFCIAYLSGNGVSVGTHRCYTHKALKATKPLKIIFLFLQLMAGQNSTFTWVRDHKLHHTYSDTDLDPHNSRRGFFFSHIGWLMVKKHPLLVKKQKQIDVSELLADKMLMFQHRYFVPLYLVVAVVFPVSVPMYFWNETLWSSFFVAYCFQYVTLLHVTWTTNSFAHLWGIKPYDKRIQATHSTVSWLATILDGWHNFHHVFPFDYRMAELGVFPGVSAYIIDFLDYVGLAYDLKTASSNIIYKHMKKYGDETGQKMLAKKEKKDLPPQKNILEILLEN